MYTFTFYKLESSPTNIIWFPLIYTPITTHCFTYKKYRGKGLYSSALSNIHRTFNDRIIWIGSHHSNVESIKVIEKLGFRKMFDVTKRTVLGIYYKIDE